MKIIQFCAVSLRIEIASAHTAVTALACKESADKRFTKLESIHFTPLLLFSTTIGEKWPHNAYYVKSCIAYKIQVQMPKLLTHFTIQLAALGDGKPPPRQLVPEYSFVTFPQW